MFSETGYLLFCIKQQKAQKVIIEIQSNSHVISLAKEIGF